MALPPRRRSDAAVLDWGALATAQRQQAIACLGALVFQAFRAESMAAEVEREQRDEDRSDTSTSAGHRLPEAVDREAGDAQPGVHRAPVRLAVSGG